MRYFNQYRQYEPVTAYTADRPTFVNGIDINTGIYPILNFQPRNAQYPFIYVPISEFSRVGAKIIWDEDQMVFRITSDYDQLKDENQQLRQMISELKAMGSNRNLRADGQNWEMHLADQGNTKYSSATMPADLTSLSLKKDPFNNASSLFSVNNNQLYSVERISKKIISATDLDTYKERWNFSTEEQNGFLDLIARDGVVYASTMTKIYALQDNGSSSQTLWTVDSFANRLLLDQNTLFYYTRTDSTEAIGTVEIKTGQKKWNYPLKTQEQIEGVFAAGGNRLYANIRNPVQMTSKMYAFDSSSGTVLWTLDLDPGFLFNGAPVYKDEKLYLDMRGTTRYLLAMDAATGRTVWRFNLTSTIAPPFSVTSDSIIILDDTNIFAIDKNTGSQKWKSLYAEQFTAGGLQTIKGSSGMVVVSDKIILDNYNKLKFFNSANGQLIYSTLQLTPTTGASGLRPIGVINDTIFVTETNQFLYTYAVPKASQLDTEKPTATIDLAPVNQLTLQDGKKQIKIPVTISETADMEVTIVDDSGTVVQTWSGRYLKGTANFYWDGKNSRGFNVIRGNYYVVVKLTDLAGNKNLYNARDKIIQITDGFGLTLKNSNLRSAASTQSTILRTIPAGSEVTITGETGDWYQIEYRIVSSVLTGYVSKPLIKVPTNQEISKIESAKTRTNVNVRTYPGTQYDTKFVLPMNTDIKIYSAIGDWYNIEYQKDSMYLDSGYVAKFTVTLPIVSSFVYTVVAGDTLWKIAQNNGVTVDSIVKANNLDPNQPIYIGQKLTIVK